MNGAHLIVSDLLSEEVIVPLVVPTVTFGAITAIVAFILYYRYRSLRLRQDLYKMFLERGVPIPTELLSAKPRVRNGDLRRGVVLLLGGVGLSLALVWSHLTTWAGFGLIPTLIGVGFLLVWKLESSSSADADPSRS